MCKFQIVLNERIILTLISERNDQYERMFAKIEMNILNEWQD